MLPKDSLLCSRFRGTRDLFHGRADRQALRGVCKKRLDSANQRRRLCGAGKGGGGHGKSIASFFEAHAPAPPDGTAVQEKRRRTGDQREGKAVSLQDPVIVIQDSCEALSQTGADGKSTASSSR